MPSWSGSAPSRSTSSSWPAPGLVHGPAHSSIGQEGGAVGSVLALTSEDSVNGSHRGHHQFLAKALHHVEPKGIDPLARPSGRHPRTSCSAPSPRSAGSTAGWSHGRGGSMHLQWKEAGAMGTNAIVGGGVPQAAGFAWAHRQAGTDAVSVTYFGDGAVNIGSTLETFNLAAAWQLPVCFFIENNRYAVSTSVERGHRRAAAVRPRARLRHRQLEGRRHGPAGGPPRHAGGASRTCGPGSGPTVVEADTYRFFHQNGAFAGKRLRLPLQGRGAGVACSVTRSTRPPATSSAAACIDAAAIADAVVPRQAGDGARSVTSCSSRSRAASPASGGSGRPSGPTRPSSTSASAAT